MTLMERVKNDLHTWLNTLATFITIGTVIFFGGALWSTVQQHSSRIDGLELRGSTALQAHVGMDDERVANLKININEIKDNLRGINTKLDQLRSDLLVKGPQNK